MKRTCKPLLFSLMAFISLITESSAQETHLIHNRERNSFATIREITEEFKALGIFEAPEQSRYSEAYNITFDNYGYLLLVEYAGQYRKIEDQKKKVIIDAFKAIGFGSKAWEIFEYEVLIEEKGQKYWFPIQNQLLAEWKNEVSKNDSVLIYVRIHAGMNTKPENKWLIVINAFSSAVSDGLWNEAIAHFQKNNHLMGIRCIDKLIERSPKDGRNYAMLAFYYTTKGNAESQYYLKADSLFEISEELSPEYSYQYVQHAILNFHQKDYSAAWTNIDKARSLGDTNIDGRFISELEKQLSYDAYQEQKKLP